MIEFLLVANMVLLVVNAMTLRRLRTMTREFEELRSRHMAAFGKRV